MLYKNKKNVVRGVVAFVFMLTLSLSTALSPLAKAEEARWTWKTTTPVPVSAPNYYSSNYVSPDGSKLFVMEMDGAYNVSFWMSADDGATWRKIFSKQAVISYASISADGSKIVLEKLGSSHPYVSADGGQSWVDRGSDPGRRGVRISPDGSFLASCSISGGVYITHISTDDGQNWTQKGTNSIECPRYVANNGTLIAKGANNKIAKSTDYGQTWTEISNFSNNVSMTSFSNNGNNVFDGDRISLDGGNHWTPSNTPVPAGYTIVQTGISDDGKKLFINAESTTVSGITTLLTSVDGGRTWHSEDGANDYGMMAMSSDGSKLFNVYIENGRLVCRVGTLPAAQPVTPGSGAGGTVAPSTGSTSATPGQKPGKASGRLAETGTSTWMVGGLAVVAVAAGALVLRKRL